MLAKRLALMAVVGSGVVSATLGAAPADGRAGGGLVVHEWGTFTNFQGSDGKQLRFNVPLGDGLPEFVLGPDNVSGAGSADWVKSSFSTLQRMETPVIYFYTKKGMDVSVNVKFPDGIISEIYPPASYLGPIGGRERVGGRQEPRRGNADIGPSMELTYDKVSLIPAGEEGGAVPPAISGVTHYAAARETDSALVKTTRNGAAHHEKFLFYRGLGDFDIPVRVQARGKDRFSFTNSCVKPTGDVYVIEIDGSRTRFAKVDGVKGEKEITLPTETAEQGVLAASIEASLVKAGLFEREAKAMVNTWKSLWLGEQGTRVIYVLPEGAVDPVLPLRIEPAPAEVRRVFVGRMDVLTPEREARMERALAARARGEGSTLEEQTRTLGRFQIPALERMARITTDEGARRQLAAMGYKPR